MPSTEGSVASFGAEQEFAGKTSFAGDSVGHFEEFVDKPILTRMPLPLSHRTWYFPKYIDRLVARGRMLDLLADDNGVVSKCACKQL